jgi:RNA polymerase sigma-70 factor, ECF subfamily
MEKTIWADHTIINQHLSGNQQAFTALVNKHRPGIYQFILKCIQNHEDTNDLSQKVFIKCYKGLTELRDKTNFKSWLFRIARNQVIDYQRNLKDIKNIDDLTADDSEAQQILSTDFNPEMTSDVVFRKKVIYRAIDQLPHEQKEVIVMKIYSQMTFAEISKVVDVSENTIKSRCYYGLTSIKKILKKWNIQEYGYHEMY